ncbi:hypothetical protein B0681_03400 [Moraxella porci DSM 25326]|uniref:Lipoprotein n=1 Tax=Moraxella porci DSM 25326 TaxID=573983 RepID=A0A1T0CV27_9GAMM|nr:hypothetical protein [Moraxella porci]OOS26196.1 hypothetical protein B0681_03400 [Moraxella porci DSM 25326]
MIKNLLMMSAVLGLTACTANPLTAYATKSQHDFLAGVEAYATRAATHDQPHATIRIYPYVTAFGHGQLSPRPMNIKQINEVIIDPKDTFSQVYELKMPFEKINVPAGEQTIIAGTHRDQHIKFTMNFVDGKDYIIKPEKIAAAGAAWRVYEYEQDARFAANAKEGILLGQPVTAVLVADYSWKR